MNDRCPRCGQTVDEQPALNRLLSWIVPPTDWSACWLWRGKLDRKGYGRFTFEGSRRCAHRAAYWLAVGPIPEGMQLDHLCRNRACVNPLHLEPVTNRENALRGRSFSAVNAAKTHCIRGHAFDAENTRWLPNGGRHCRACARLRAQNTKTAGRLTNQATR